MKKLGVGEIFSNGIGLGLKNAPSLIAAVLLWAVTFWIPYLNVGTTIGLLGIIAKMGRAGVVSPLEIFNSGYRKQMGEFFLVMAFLFMGVLAGYAFIVIPGMVIGIAWCLAPLLVVDKGRNPSAAIQESNNLTYGNKWAIFLASFLFGIIALIVGGLLFYIGAKIHVVVGIVAMAVVYIAVMTINAGMFAYVYHALTAEPAGAPADLQPTS